MPEKTFIYMEGNPAFGEYLYNIGWMPTKEDAERQAKQEIRARRRRGITGRIRYKCIPVGRWRAVPQRLKKVRGGQWTADLGEV